MLENYFKLLLCFGLMFIGFAAFSSEELLIPQIGHPPQIDGKFDESEWAEASCASGFINTSDEWSFPQTSAYIGINGEHLYFAFKCFSFELGKITAVKYKNDSRKIFSGDSVELFLAAERNGKTYYHMAFNPAGSAYSAKCGEKRDESWNPELKVAAGITDNAWILEGRLPLKSIGAKNEPGAKWKLNFCRNNKGVPASWTGQKDFNVKKLMGNALTVEKALFDYSLESLNLKSGMQIILRNHQGKDTACKLELSYAGKKDLHSYVLKPKEIKKISDIPLLPSAKGRKIELKVSGKGFKYEKEAYIILCKILSIRPDYYYYYPGSEKLNAEVKNYLAKGSSIEISLYSSDDKKPLQKMDIKAFDKAFALNIKGLPLGRYVLKSRLLDKNGSTLEEDDKVFFIKERFENLKLPEKQEIELNNCIINMNGKPFFPLMISASPPDYISNCFNAAYAPKSAMTNSLGLGVCGVPTKLKRKPFLFRQLPDDKKTRKTISAYLKKTSGGNYLFRRIEYEAQIPLFRKDKETLIPLQNGEEYFKINRLVRKITPETLTSIQTDKQEKIREFKNCADIIEVASYASSYAKEPLENMARDIEFARSEIGDKPLIWWIGASIPKPEFRNAANIRAASYMAVMNGANGIIYHNGHGGVPASRTRLWSIFPELVKEIEFIYPIITTGEKMPDEIKTKNKDLKIVVRKHEGTTYIFALNPTLFTIREKIFLNQKNGKALVLFENRNLEVIQGCLEDEFTPDEPHVYKILNGRADVTVSGFRGIRTFSQ